MSSGLSELESLFLYSPCPLLSFTDINQHLIAFLGFVLDLETILRCAQDLDLGSLPVNMRGPMRCWVERVIKSNPGHQPVR